VSSDAMILLRFPNRAPCRVEGCERPWVTKHLCNGHYKRLWKYGDVRASEPLGRGRAKQECIVERCDKQARSKGLCAGHHSRLLRWGSPLAGEPLKERSENVPMLRTSPLRDYMKERSLTPAVAFGWSERLQRLYYRDRIGVYSADLLACALGVHPWFIWGDDWWIVEEASRA
jgi:hypothetical protein